MLRTEVKVLLVDDDEIHQFIMVKTLESTGNTGKITVCSDGKEALEFLKINMHDSGSLPDMILLDINMPIMDGWDFLNEYQFFRTNFPKDIRVILVTSSLDERDIQRFRHYDFVETYAVKPLKRERLVELLSNKVKA